MGYMSICVGQLAVVVLPIQLWKVHCGFFFSVLLLVKVFILILSGMESSLFGAASLLLGGQAFAKVSVNNLVSY